MVQMRAPMARRDDIRDKPKKCVCTLTALQPSTLSAYGQYGNTL